MPSNPPGAVRRPPVPLRADRSDPDGPLSLDLNVPSPASPSSDDSSVYTPLCNLRQLTLDRSYNDRYYLYLVLRRFPLMEVPRLWFVMNAEEKREEQGLCSFFTIANPSRVKELLVQYACVHNQIRLADETIEYLEELRDWVGETVIAPLVEGRSANQDSEIMRRLRRGLGILEGLLHKANKLRDELNSLMVGIYNRKRVYRR